MVCLFVSGEPITFLEDTRSAMSAIDLELMSKPPTTIGASGVTLKELITHAFTINTFLGECCPVNLAGSDLLCKLGIHILCEGKGLPVVQPQETSPHDVVRHGLNMSGTMHGMYRIFMGHTMTLLITFYQLLAVVGNRR